MKIFILALRMIKQRAWGLFLLSAEMIISVVVLLTFLSEIGHLLQSRDAAYSVAADENYYFSGYWSYYLLKDFDVINMIPANVSERVPFGISASTTVSTTDGNVYALVYSDLVLDGMALLDTFSGYENCPFIPAVSFGGAFSEGDKVITKAGECIYVIKSIDDVLYLPFFSGMSSSDILTPDKYTKRVTGSGLILRLANDTVTLNSRRTDSLVFDPGKLSETELEELLSLLSGYGQTVNMKQIKDNYIRENKIDLINNVIMFLVFAVTVTVGIYGTNCMWGEKNRRKYAIMYIVGMSKNVNVVLEIIVSGFVFVVTYGAILIFYEPVIASFISYDIGEGKILYCLFIMLYFMTVYMLSSYESVKNASKCNLIENYKRNVNEN